MFKLFRSIFTLKSAMGPEQNSEPKTSLPKIILFGDSLTQWSFLSKDSKGLGDVLTAHFKGRAIVENEGQAGWNSTWLRPTFEHIIERVRNHETQSPLLFTIWLGANDAAPPEYAAHVPIAKYEENLRLFVESILSEPKMEQTKVVLITPPPINVPDPSKDENKDEFDLGPAVRKAFREAEMEKKGYKTFVNKARYAARVMEIAKSFCKSDYRERVVGLDFWRAVVNFQLKEDERDGLDEGKIDWKYEELKIPGSGLPGAGEYREEMFTDRLHLGTLGYDILSAEFFKVVGDKWPDFL